MTGALGALAFWMECHRIWTHQHKLWCELQAVTGRLTKTVGYEVAALVCHFWECWHKQIELQYWWTQLLGVLLTCGVFLFGFFWREGLLQCQPQMWYEPDIFPDAIWLLIWAFQCVMSFAPGDAVLCSGFSYRLWRWRGCPSCIQ